MAISAATGEGTRELAQRAFQVLREQLARETVEAEAVPPVLRPQPRRRRFYIEHAPDGTVVVRGRTPEWLSATFDLEDVDARQELLDRLRRLGLARALAREGVTVGTKIFVGGTALVWE